MNISSGELFLRQFHQVAVVLPTQIAVDLQKAGEHVVGRNARRSVSSTQSPGRRAAGSGRRFRCGSADTDFDKHHVVERRDGLIASLVAREDLDGRVDRLIEEQREERHAQRRIAADARTLRRIPDVFLVADSHPRDHVVRRRAIDDELAAAQIDVVEGREHRDRRRLEAHLHVTGDRRFRLTDPVDHRSCGVNDDAGRSGFEVRDGLLADGPADPELIRVLLVASRL